MVDSQARCVVCGDWVGTVASHRFACSECDEGPLCHFHYDLHMEAEHLYAAIEDDTHEETAQPSGKEE